VLKKRRQSEIVKVSQSFGFIGEQPKSKQRLRSKRGSLVSSDSPSNVEIENIPLEKSGKKSSKKSSQATPAKKTGKKYSQRKSMYSNSDTAQ